METATPAKPLDPGVVRGAFGHFPSGVAALSAELDGADEVLVASAFTVGVSLDPPLVSVAVRNASETWKRMALAERIGISVLAAGQDRACRQLASADRSRRLEGLATERSPAGAIFLAGSPLLLETRIHAVLPAGDHQVALLEVLSLEADASVEPLVFHRSGFRTLRDGG